MGVTSLIMLTSRPAACRGADGGLTAGAGALHVHFHGLHAMLHGNGSRLGGCLRGEGSGFREPRKPSSPELAQETALPWVSVMVTIVLLKVD